MGDDPNIIKAVKAPKAVNEKMVRLIFRSP